MELTARQELLPDWGPKITALLKNKRVGVAGLGGLGGVAAYLLAGAGVGQLRLADGDTVSMSNLHRQIMYRGSALGQNKALNLKESIEALQAGTELICVPEVLTFKLPAGAADAAPEQLSHESETARAFVCGLDLLLLLTDSVKSRVELGALALELKVNVLQLCVTGFVSQEAAFLYAQPEFTQQHGCSRCFWGPYIDEESSGQAELKVSEPGAQGILGPTAVQAAAAAALSALLLLTDRYPAERKGSLWIFDHLKQQGRLMKLRPDPHCPLCQQRVQ